MVTSGCAVAGTVAVAVAVAGTAGCHAGGGKPWNDPGHLPGARAATIVPRTSITAAEVNVRCAAVPAGGRDAGCAILSAGN